MRASFDCRPLPSLERGARFGAPILSGQVTLGNITQSLRKISVDMKNV